jgi:hypothetical protein
MIHYTKVFFNSMLGLGRGLRLLLHLTQIFFSSEYRIIILLQIIQLQEK